MNSHMINKYKLKVSFQIVLVLQIISIISSNKIHQSNKPDITTNNSLILKSRPKQNLSIEISRGSVTDDNYLNSYSIVEDGSIADRDPKLVVNSKNHYGHVNASIAASGVLSNLIAQEYQSQPNRIVFQHRLPSIDKRRTQRNEKKLGLDDEDTYSKQRISRQLIKINYPGYPNTTQSTAHSARTRITVSGASVRDHLLPLAIINLTRNGRPDRTEALVDSSRVITIPKRLILPEDALKPEKHTLTVSIKQTSTNINQTLPKPDLRCPQFGVMTLEHPTACDKYYYCEDGLMSEVTCPNGLMYGTRDTIVHFCIHRWQTFCGDKNIPNPISSPGCRWQYGIFHVQGSPKCSPNYYECTAGKFKVQRCRIEGQVYDDRSKSCQPAQVVGCANELVTNFRCPPDDQNNAFWPFPRYFLNDKAFIHCANDKPEVIRCSSDERVDPDFLHCSPVDKLVNLYALETLTEYEKNKTKQQSTSS